MSVKIRFWGEDGKGQFVWSFCGYDGEVLQLRFASESTEVKWLTMVWGGSAAMMEKFCS
jgi:hypothetical protein